MKYYKNCIYPGFCFKTVFLVKRPLSHPDLLSLVLGPFLQRQNKSNPAVNCNLKQCKKNPRNCLKYHRRFAETIVYQSATQWRKKMSILGFGKKQDDKFIKSIFVDSISCWEHYYDGQKCRIHWRKPKDMWAWVRRMRAKGVVVEKGDYTVGSEYDYD